MCCVVRGNSWGPIFADNQLTHWCFCVFSVVACSCHPVGSAVLPFSSVTFCDPSNGDCPCKPGDYPSQIIEKGIICIYTSVHDISLKFIYVIIYTHIKLNMSE